MSISPPYNITLVNNSSYTFTAIIRPTFLLPKNFLTPSPTSLGPYSSQVYTATNDNNSIWFKISAPYTTTDLLVWAVNDGSSWSARAGWVTDLDSGPKVVPSDIYIVANAAGSGGHTITIQPGAAKRGIPRDDTDSPAALAVLARGRRFRA
ncbi:uncharacterized protein DFL_008761 [Arthrobotrys flagrans]|uniref:Uncharacterized protein n=1 Tax=Arthrobotrys flagrans TaxID=97331 RepID=A0A436ZPR0_ARTFL|nr:hypothetical protein DFL_008761 [Arthrobotrys flagrans]